MRKQDSKKRIKNFNEVALGLSEKEAIKEAARCLGCKKAKCVTGCPVDIDIPEFIRLIKKREYDKAIKKIKERNNLPAICGRVCPQEDQCEQTCILRKKSKGIKIGYLERFAADWEIKKKSKVKSQKSKLQLKTKKLNKKVAVIGSGPAGLTCAAELAKMGYNVVVFESLHKPGGVLVYGIPEFRLPKKIVDIEVEYVKSLGAEVRSNMVIGKVATINDLKKRGYGAIFIGTGAGLPYFLGIAGENLVGVYSANEFLTRTNLMKAYLFPEYDTPVRIGNKVAVIGGGNVAMDSARCAKRLGAEEVICVYRRSEEEMPARIEEIENAKEEGIRFEFLANPLRIIGNDKGWVKEMVCIRNRLGEPDESGRRKPLPIKGSEFKIELDSIVCAIGQGPNPLLLSTAPDLKLNKHGYIEIDEEGISSIPGIFAGGDIVTGAATVISAMGAGKKAAASIDRYLKGLSLRAAEGGEAIPT